jgi:hypothetical protein
MIVRVLRGVRSSGSTAAITAAALERTFPENDAIWWGRTIGRANGGAPPLARGREIDRATDLASSDFEDAIDHWGGTTSRCGREGPTSPSYALPAWFAVDAEPFLRRLAGGLSHQHPQVETR